MEQQKSVSLYFTEGSSDKSYQASLRQRDGGWVVDFSYGPRGKAQKTGTKTETPVTYAAADKIFEKLVREKTAKGYTPDESGTAYTNTELALVSSGLAPQLPTAITEASFTTLMGDPMYALQEKRDGENRTLQVTEDGSRVRGINRRGLYVDIPQAWTAIQLDAIGNTVFAGEHMLGDQFDAFDLLEIAGEDLRSQPYAARHARLVQVAAQLGASWFKVLPLHRDSADKRGEVDRLRACQAEGVVFKRLDAPFESGRSAAALKFKFVDSATCIVVRQNQQRSVVVGLLDAGGNMEELGNVTIPADKAVPAVDTLVEVRYLYRYERGCFEQPVYLGPRTDMTRTDATADQIARIKRKTAQEMPAMAE